MLFSGLANVKLIPPQSLGETTKLTHFCQIRSRKFTAFGFCLQTPKYFANLHVSNDGEMREKLSYRMSVSDGSSVGGKVFVIVAMGIEWVFLRLILRTDPSYYYYSSNNILQLRFGFGRQLWMPQDLVQFYITLDSCLETAAAVPATEYPAVLENVWENVSVDSTSQWQHGDAFWN